MSGVSAFPTAIDGINVHGDPGMTLRDWFAAQADVEAYTPFKSFVLAHDGRSPTVAELAEYIAKIRFIEADAMLAERSKP